MQTHGLSAKFSGRDFNREKVRIRDNHTCQLCKKLWGEGQRRFDIHHLNGICGKKSKGYDKEKDFKGLITYCHKCHLNLHSVRRKMFLGWINSDKKNQLGNYKQFIKRNKEIRKLRDDDNLTLQEIGDLKGISRERVRQICLK